MEETQMEEGENNRDVEVAPALIAVHPIQKSVAVAIGSDLRVFDLQAGCAVSLVDDSGGPLHKDSIRAIRFGAEGKLFVSAGDDKLVKIWTTESWHCISTVCSEKRVTVFPKNPLDGAHEIQSFCLGHTEFVSCLTFVCTPDYPLGFLVSGSGDSTVRLWDITSGSLLHTCEVGAEAGLLESNGREGQCYPAITDLCATPDCTLIAVAIQRQCHCSLQGVMLISCDFPTRTLSVAKVTGVSNLCGDSPSLARVRVISGFKKSNLDSIEHEPIVLEDNAIPVGEKLLEKLQGSVFIEEKVLSAAAEAVKTAMCNLLIKKQYSTEKREFRKRTRNDRKIKH
ncbi:hypothetical protein L1049_003936 [Liquidambar formosana]|uniref:tRNA (guanine-N(7)-)-methyltransferase non-catalytic subunit n=1 Tax=Liquidambar formosana TaxID=63359 RepID=A0AAP0RRN8_LIQFO